MNEILDTNEAVQPEFKMEVLKNDVVTFGRISKLLLFIEDGIYQVKLFKKMQACGVYSSLPSIFTGIPILVKEGLIELKIDEDVDKREKKIYLTEKGKRFRDIVSQMYKMTSDIIESK